MKKLFFVLVTCLVFNGSYVLAQEIDEEVKFCGNVDGNRYEVYCHDLRGNTDDGLFLRIFRFNRPLFGRIAVLSKETIIGLEQIGRRFVERDTQGPIIRYKAENPDIADVNKNPFVLLIHTNQQLKDGSFKSHLTAKFRGQMYTETLGCFVRRPNSLP